MSEFLEIQVLDGPKAGQRFPLDKPLVRLGRSSSNNIPIPDSELSRNHCVFERGADGLVKVADLASANGTLLNGHDISQSKESVLLRPGDTIQVGATHLRVVSEAFLAAAEQKRPAIDLGLEGASSSAASPAPAPSRNRRRVAFLYGLAFLCVAGAAAFCLLSPRVLDKPEKPIALPIEAKPVILEAYYEHVEASTASIFRYELKYAQDGTLQVTLDDVPNENRHLTKERPLDARAVAELNDILARKTLVALDGRAPGVSCADQAKFASWTLNVIYSDRICRVRIVDEVEPEEFRAVRERLEAFTKNELGVWAIQYPRAKLMAMADEAIELGEQKWQDRDVQNGNLFASIQAFRDALFHLDTVNPKPASASLARDGLVRAQAELERRYNDQRFRADRAINMQLWPMARTELKKLLEMIPDRRDDRYREAAAKLTDVEKRIGKGDL